MTRQFNNNLKVAFVCVHNSCRSQMAEGFLKRLAGDDFVVYSAGSEDQDSINPNAVEVMKEIDIDISEQYPKSLSDIPTEIDILITMGCDVKISDATYHYTEDWAIDDPTDGSLDDFRKVRDIIKQKCIDLIERIEGGKLVINYDDEQPFGTVTDEQSFDTTTDDYTVTRNDYQYIIDAQHQQAPAKMRAYEYEELINTVNERANYPLGILLGLVFGLIGAGIWALITKLTGYNLGIIAIAVGFLVSQGFVIAGRSTKLAMGITAAIIALISVFFGNIVNGFLQIADYHNKTFFYVLMNFDYENYLVDLIIKVHNLYDIIFYGIAMLTAFRRSFIDKNSLNVDILPDRYTQQNDIFE